MLEKTAQDSRYQHGNTSTLNHLTWAKIDTHAKQMFGILAAQKNGNRVSFASSKTQTMKSECNELSFHKIKVIII